MTERLADIAARIEGVRQLGTVVKAMRGIAAARVQQARRQLLAVEHYAATISAAISSAVALASPVPSQTETRSARTAIVVFCAEQGFAGAFSERVLDAAGPDLATAELFLIGTRGNAVAAERGVVADWKSPMASHSASIPKLADRIADALYARIATGAIDRLETVFAKGQSGSGIYVERMHLFPLDVAQFTSAANANPPLSNLPPSILLSELASDYLHAQLCSAALHAFAAENAVRMSVMEAAHHQTERQLTALRGMQRQRRQEEITVEIVELAAGAAAGHLARN